MTPLMTLALAWLAGLVLAAWLRPSPATAFLAAAGAGVAVVALWAGERNKGPGHLARRPPPSDGVPAGRLQSGPAGQYRRLGSTTARLALVSTLAFARYAWADRSPDRTHVMRFNQRGPMVFTGRIVDEPDIRDRGVQYRVEVETARREKGAAAEATHGLVLAQGSAFPLFQYGDSVVFTTTLEAPPKLDGFDYRAYLARQGVYSTARFVHFARLSHGGNSLRKGLVAIKGQGKAALAASIAEPEAALATGILLGDDRGLPRRLAEAFRTTNTSHVIAISGSNIALLVAVVAALFGRIGGRRRAALPTIAVVAVYTVLVGADPAVVRAAVMGAIAVLAGPWGRRNHGPTALAAAALAMTLWNPLFLHDLGFQLSFAATAGLMGLTEPLNRTAQAVAERIRGSGVALERMIRVPAILRESLVLTLAAELATLPIIATSTGQVSGVGLFANLLIGPAQPFIMLGAGLTAIAGSVLAPLGQLLGAFTWLPLTWTIRVVEAAAHWPFAAIVWPLPPIAAVAYFALLVAWAWPDRRAVRLDALRRLGAAAVDRAGPVNRALGGWRLVGLLAATGAIVWSSALSSPDGLLHLFVLDVGQGDALLVVSPNGERMLVDGGPGKSGVLAGLGRRFPPWDRRLDLAVLTHQDADHVGGMAAVLERFKVGLVLDSEVEGGSGEAAAWRAGLREEGARIVRAETGQRVVLDEAAGVEARVLWPPKERRLDLDPPTNNNAVVLRLEYGQTAMLLTGDIEAPVEEALLATGQPLAAAVLKVAHHGSAGSSESAFLSAVRPRLAVISVGADNSFGHPAPEALERLGPIEVRRTDRDGLIEVISDGKEVWVR